MKTYDEIYASLSIPKDVKRKKMREIFLRFSPGNRENQIMIGLLIFGTIIFWFVLNFFYNWNLENNRKSLVKAQVVEIQSDRYAVMLLPDGRYQSETLDAADLYVAKKDGYLMVSSLTLKGERQLVDGLVNGAMFISGFLFIFGSFCSVIGFGLVMINEIDMKKQEIINAHRSWEEELRYQARAQYYALLDESKKTAEDANQT